MKYGYRDRAGIDSRANSALSRIGDIVDDVYTPAAVRLVRIAEIMAVEPILTDLAPASYGVRREATTAGGVPSYVPNCSSHEPRERQAS